MKTNELMCKANGYHMSVIDGEERHNRAYSLSGKDMTGTPSWWAKLGQYPNYTYVMTFGEALDQARLWIGNCIIWGDSWGDVDVKRAYFHDYRRKYDELAKGDTIFEVAIDKKYKGGGIDRVKIIFTKA